MTFEDFSTIHDIEASDLELAPLPVSPDSPTFDELGARAETVAALAAVGITRAFAIQEYALPIAIRGADLIGQAPTGTGKTLGFGIPLLERVVAVTEGATGRPQALVVVPTRELCIQVARDIAAAGATRGVRVAALYGGVAYEPQTAALTRGLEIVVGTPGRLLDLAQSKQLRLDGIGALVLDEADRMLDLGFLDDIEKILAMLPAERQTMLFSATMPDPIVALARRFMRQPMTVHAGHDVNTGPSPHTKQLAYRTHSLNKVEVVARILQSTDRGLTIIFTRTKRAADRLSDDLDFRGFAVAAVHGDLGQGSRERALRAFRSGKVDILVATDVAARGLDVTGVTHVINYDCPEDTDTYIHRIGRTGRAGATGVAVTFVDWEDLPRWQLIDKTLQLDISDPPETYHTSPWLFTDLDIASTVGATLPSADRTRAGLSAEVLEDVEGRSGRSRRPGRTRGRGGSSERSRGSDRTPAERSHGSGPTQTPTEAEPRPTRTRRRRRITGDSVHPDRPEQNENSDPSVVSDADPADLAVAPTGRADDAVVDAETEVRERGRKTPRRRRRRRGDNTGGDNTGTDGGAAADGGTH